MTTARQITAAMRLLFPAPVRLAARAVRLPRPADSPPETGPGSDGLFLLRLPSSPAAAMGSQRDRWHGLTTFLGRHLSEGIGPARVTVVRARTIRRRDCGRDVEFLLRVGGGSDGA